MQEFSKWIFKIMGWKAVVTVPEPPKSVICVAPHTSNWDFVIGKLYYWSLNRKSSFLMKKSWFFFPLGSLLRSMGGISVDRNKRTSVTDGKRFIWLLPPKEPANWQLSGKWVFTRLRLKPRCLFSWHISTMQRKKWALQALCIPQVTRWLIWQR